MKWNTPNFVLLLTVFRVFSLIVCPSIFTTLTLTPLPSCSSVKPSDRLLAQYS